MSGNFFHFLAESIHHLFVEQPVLQILDRIDQVDRWVLDNQQQTEASLMDFSQPMDWAGSDITDFSN